MGELLKPRPGSFPSEVATFFGGALLMSIVSALRPLSSPNESKYRRAHGDADADQHQAETQSKRQIAFARLKYDRRRHGAGVTSNIAAYDEDGPDFGDRSTRIRLGWLSERAVAPSRSDGG